MLGVTTSFSASRLVPPALTRNELASGSIAAAGFGLSAAIGWAGATLATAWAVTTGSATVSFGWIAAGFSRAMVSCTAGSADPFSAFARFNASARRLISLPQV